VPQTWVDQALRGVADGLNSLNKDDRFNIVFFKEKTIVFSPDALKPFTDKTLAEALKFLKERDSSGYTDVNRALSRMLKRDLAAERVYDLILISDGKPTQGVQNTRELINLITRDNDLTASIYCVGIGTSQDRKLLEFLAYRNKGVCVFVAHQAETANAIRDLMSRLRYPLIKDLRLSVVGLDADEVFPRDLPNVHQGDTFSIFGRYDAEKPFTMRLIGYNRKTMLDVTLKGDLTNAPVGEDKIAYDWAFWKLHDLYNEMIRQGETESIKQAIEYLRRKYRLKTLY